MQGEEGFSLDGVGILETIYSRPALHEDGTSEMAAGSRLKATHDPPDHCIVRNGNPLDACGHLEGWA